MKAIKLLLISNSDLTFIRDDFHILNKHFSVRWLILKNKYEYIKLLNAYRYDVIYCWLGHYHSFVATIINKLFKKKFIIHIGGHEVSTINKFNFGAKAKKIRYFAIQYSLHNANLIILAGDHLKDKLLKEYRIEEYQVEVVNHGFDFKFWDYVDSSKKENKVITTIADSNSLKRLNIKGIPSFINAAQIISHITFIIIGISKENLKCYFNNLPDNLVAIGHVPRSLLRKHLVKSKVYCQLSLTEGFGMALCEAMLSGCIPVVSNVGMMPSIIEDSGYVIMKNNINEIVNKIENALKNENYLSPRKIILNKFNMDRREMQLLNIIEKLIHP